MFSRIIVDAFLSAMLCDMHLFGDNNQHVLATWEEINSQKAVRSLCPDKKKTLGCFSQLKPKGGVSLKTRLISHTTGRCGLRMFYLGQSTHSVKDENGHALTARC